MFRFSLRNVFRRKWVLVIAIVGTALGCALMTILLSIADGLDQRLNQTMSEFAGVLVVSPKDAPLGFGTGGKIITLPASYAAEIAAMEHVEVVSASVNAFITKEMLPVGDPIGVPLTGVVYEQDRALNGPLAHVSVGEAPQGEDEIIIGKTLWNFAKRYRGGEGLEPADLLGHTFTVGPDSRKLTIVGVYDTGSLLIDVGFYGDIDTARAMSNLSPDEVSGITLRADSVENVPTLAQRIEERFKDEDYPVTVLVPTDILGQATEALGVFQQALWAISVVAVVAGGTSIFIVMFMSVTERRREFGILKASGWAHSNILLSVLVESVTIALMGFALGLGLGLGANFGINRYLGEQIASATVILGAEVLGFGIIMGIIGGLYPAIRATRVSPMEALRAV